MLLTVESEHVTELFSSIGERRKRAETVAREAADEAERYLAADVPVGAHLADQLLLPLALAGGGAYVTTEPTEHLRTNIDVLGRFLPVPIALEKESRNRWRVSVGS